jgi:competence protein ComEC
LLTHGDLKHIGGAELLQSLFGLNEVYTSGVRFRSPVYRKVVADFDQVLNQRKLVHRGDCIGDWRVLHPQRDEKTPQADDSALVLLGEFHGTRVLLLSDLGRPGQELLMEREKDLRADIVVAGLPEQSEPICDGLLDRIQPRVIVIADSEFPATRRASARLRDRLEQRKVPVIYTYFNGAVTMRIDKSGWELRGMDAIRVSSPDAH